jgi:hypothetical protein
MIKPKTAPKKRAADLTAARKAGGDDDQQSHWMARLFGRLDEIKFALVW